MKFQICDNEFLAPIFIYNTREYSPPLPLIVHPNMLTLIKLFANPILFNMIPIDYCILKEALFPPLCYCTLPFNGIESRRVTQRLQLEDVNYGRAH